MLLPNYFHLASIKICMHAFSSMKKILKNLKLFVNTKFLTLVSFLQPSSLALCMPSKFICIGRAKNRLETVFFPPLYV